jgi:hypothetical protein
VRSPGTRAIALDGQSRVGNGCYDQRLAEGRRSVGLGVVRAQCRSEGNRLLGLADISIVPAPEPSTRDDDARWFRRTWPRGLSRLAQRRLDRGGGSSLPRALLGVFVNCVAGTSKRMRQILAALDARLVSRYRQRRVEVVP